MDEALRDALADAESRHWWYEGRRRILAAVMETLGTGPDATILEIGCGSGANLSVLSRFGAVHACEPDRADRERARARNVGPVEDGSLPDGLPFGKTPFDVVALLDVLEHVDDDAASLLAIRSRLKPGGHLVITVPAHAWLWGTHDVRNHHRRRYGRRQLVRRLEDAGLEVELVSWFNTLLFPLVVPVRLFGGGGFGTAVPPRPVNRGLTALLSAEKRAVVHDLMPFGVSLLAVARLPGTAGNPSRSAQEPV